MRILGKLIIFEDEYTTYLWGKIRIKNQRATVLLATFQFIITFASSAQHGYSIIRFKEVLKCSFNNTRYDTLHGILTGSDIIIFDFGLFHRLLGTTECIANYLDGGYGRLLWCLYHTPACFFTTLIVLCNFPRPRLLMPMLLIQSMYFMGIIILITATSPRLLKAAFGYYHVIVYLHMFIFFACSLVNFFLTFILWHLYWHWKGIVKRANAEAESATFAATSCIAAAVGSSNHPAITRPTTLVGCSTMDKPLPSAMKQQPQTEEIVPCSSTSSEACEDEERDEESEAGPADTDSYAENDSMNSSSLCSIGMQQLNQPKNRREDMDRMKANMPSTSMTTSSRTNARKLPLPRNYYPVYHNSVGGKMRRHSRSDYSTPSSLDIIGVHEGHFV